MPVLYILIATFITVFLESFFTALCGFKLFYLVTLIFFRKIDWKYIFSFVVISSLILDVVSHYILGTNLLIIIIPLIVMFGISFLIPIENSFPGYVVKFLSFVIYYLLSYLVPNLLLEGIFQTVSWTILGEIILKSIISVGLCFLFDLVWNGIRNKEKSTKLRLK